jgi:hypothetical protein
VGSGPQCEREPDEPALLVALGAGLLAERRLDVLERAADRGGEPLGCHGLAVRQQPDRVR